MNKLKITLSLIIFCVLSACFGCQNLPTKSMPKGVFKSFDLKSKLPEDLANGSLKNIKEYSEQIAVGEPAEKMFVKWKTFKQGENYYIVSADVEVTEALKGTELTNAAIGDPINKGTSEKAIQENQILISWDSSKTGLTQTGTTSVTILATGELSQTN